MELRICIDVDDMERAVAFYTAGLGLQVGRGLLQGGGLLQFLAQGGVVQALRKRRPGFFHEDVPVARRAQALAQCAQAVLQRRQRLLAPGSGAGQRAAGHA